MHSAAVWPKVDIVLVGCPNAGKSTLFNRLSGSRQALIANLPGVTRDLQYARGNGNLAAWVLVDTAGWSTEPGELGEAMRMQTREAVARAQLVLVLMDAVAGYGAEEDALISMLRKHARAMLLVVNKIDAVQELDNTAYYIGGFSPHFIAARSGYGLQTLRAVIIAAIATDNQPEFSKDHEAVVQEPVDAYPTLETLRKTAKDAICLALLGRPNVGKSTLSNALLGYSRQLVHDQAGTTRDSVCLSFMDRGQRFILIDTAGIRRHAQVHQVVEKFSVAKALEAAQAVDIVLLMMDATEGVVSQDIQLLRRIDAYGRAALVVVNKCDALDASGRAHLERTLTYRLRFVQNLQICYLAARQRRGINTLLRSLHNLYAQMQQHWGTARLNALLQQAITAHPPPKSGGKPVRLRFAHSGGRRPPLIIVHGARADRLPEHYRRYLLHFYRDQLHAPVLQMAFRARDSVKALRN